MHDDDDDNNNNNNKINFLKKAGFSASFKPLVDAYTIFHIMG